MSHYPRQLIAQRDIGNAFIAPLAWTASLENILLLGRPIPRVDGLPSLHFMPYINGFRPISGHVIEIKPDPQLATGTPNPVDQIPHLVLLDIVDQILDLVLVATMLDDIKVTQKPEGVFEVLVQSWLPANPWETLE